MIKQVNFTRLINKTQKNHVFNFGGGGGGGGCGIHSHNETC